MGSNIENCARVEIEGTQSEPNFLRNRLQSKTATVNKDFSLRPAVDCSFCNSIDFWICYGGIWTLMWGWELSSVCINRFTPPVLLCGFSFASTLRKDFSEIERFQKTFWNVSLRTETSDANQLRLLNFLPSPMLIKLMDVLLPMLIKRIFYLKIWGRRQILMFFWKGY